jgi:hypothetical protein
MSNDAGASELTLRDIRRSIMLRLLFEQPRMARDQRGSLRVLRFSSRFIYCLRSPDIP